MGRLLANQNIERANQKSNYENSDCLIAMIYELFTENKIEELGFAGQKMCYAICRAFIDTATDEELILHENIGDVLAGIRIDRNEGKIEIVNNDERTPIEINPDNTLLDEELCWHNREIVDPELDKLRILLMNCDRPDLNILFIQEAYTDEKLQNLLQRVLKEEKLIDEKKYSGELMVIRNLAEEIMGTLKDYSIFTELTEKIEKILEILPDAD